VLIYLQILSSVNFIYDFPGRSYRCGHSFYNVLSLLLVKFVTEGNNKLK